MLEALGGPHLAAGAEHGEPAATGHHQWVGLMKRCMDHEWDMNEVDIRCACDVEALALMTMMTKFVFINIDECQFSYEGLGAAARTVQHSYSCRCAEIRLKSVCMNKMLSCATEINKYLKWELVEKAVFGFITLKKSCNS